MAMIFRAMAGLAYDNITVNPLLNASEFITILSSSVSSPVNLDEYLSLELSCSQNEVLVEGVFNFSLSGVAVEATDSIEVEILFYSDLARTNLVYQTINIISGITLTNTQEIQWSVPVQFQDDPILKVTDNTVNYYITVNGILDGITIGTGELLLEQYSVSATEIAANQGFNCYGGL